ncbi:MAG: hypothetical protein JWP17_2357 [Solirubrobacterales bacterium]|nr:hypothetical protein [Solirubrobacterales bacterium]
MNRDEEADHTQDPRGTDTGAGYPEEQPSGAQPGVQRDEGHERQGRSRGDDAPDGKDDQDGDPGQATGNPNAAG